MNFIWDIYPTTNWVVSIVLIVIIYAILFLICSKIIKRTAGYVALSFSLILCILTFILALTAVYVLVVTLTSVVILISLFANLGDLRKFLANPFKVSRGKYSKVAVEKIYNREEFYKTIEKTVISLSKTRTGAIITFEKSTSLDDIIKNGVLVKAPATNELLQTIFYPGTRLHDGAVVIRDNMILAASVFYTPTTKPFAGKYGSRHRAALGISEITDSITVVVSEETGRISFAVNGQLEAATPENFYRMLENYMDGVSAE